MGNIEWCVNKHPKDMKIQESGFNVRHKEIPRDGKYRNKSASGL
jgi:hypothetical protein